MAALINIAGLTPVVDPAYRYKMPRIMGKVEGRGNGIKTVLVNVNDVATALKRDAPEITKFFGCELGAQTTFSADSDRAIVNGSHRDADLQQNLHKYIENFVLCKKCRLPETHYKIKDGLISQKCLACGNKDTVDMTHKLTTFILAQHKLHKKLQKEKEGDKSGDKKESKKDKEKEKDKSEKKKEKKEKSSEEDKSEKKEKKSKKKDKSADEEDAAGEEEADNVFGITASTGSAAAVDDDEEEEEEDTNKKAAEDGMERYKLFRASNAASSVSQHLDELRNIQTMASLRPADRIIIFLGSVFTEDAIVANQVETHKEYLKALSPTEIQQRHLIAAFEWFCGSKFPQFNRLFSKVLMQLYEAEIVEEDTFLAWAADTTRNEFTADDSMIEYETLETLRNHAFPFVKWLQEAEEEGEDDEEEEEEEGEEEDDEA